MYLQRFRGTYFELYSNSIATMPSIPEGESQEIVDSVIRWPPLSRISISKLQG
jgi:hypothetical protein